MEEEGSSTTLGFLEEVDDDLLIEILSRIPSTRSAFQCKLVCKGWCSLMSSPYFVGRFKLAADRRGDDDDINSSDRSFIIIKKPMELEYHWPRRTTTDLVVNIAGRNPTPVLAYCNDLTLCHSGTNNNMEEYYLCNPFTKQRVALEQPLYCRRELRNCSIRFGFIYELAPDNYSIYRYRVVRFRSFYCDLRGGRRVEVRTYHSETCQWVESEFYQEKEFSVGSEIIAYSGKLHWVNYTGSSLFTYDPFTTRQEQRISSVDGPCINSDMDEGHYLFHAGECGGVLRITAIQNSTSDNFLTVWDLETDGHGRWRNWSLKHNVPMNCNSTVGVGFSLKKDVVVFLLSVFRLVSYNLQSGEVKVEGQGAHNGSGLTMWDGVFLLQLPRWPTPIPKPCKQNA